jgi:Cu-Zn family superoxide dismutase
LLLHRVVSRAGALAALVVSMLPTAAHAESGLPATTQLLNAAGEVVAAATFSPAQTGVRIDVVGWKLSPGAHGIHIHTTGKCDAPGFASAGGHLNPDGKKHGLDNADGPHAGDLPNLMVKDDGTAYGWFVDERISFAPGASSLFKDGGTALVIHAAADDGKTDPSGNSGDRIACGVIAPGGASPVAPVAQSPAFAAMRANYEGLTDAQVRARGYDVDSVCVNAAEVGLPAAAGSMGFHAINGRFYGPQFQTGEWDSNTPPILLLDGSRRVVGVEWEGGSWNRPAPAAYGQSAPLLPGHPGPPSVNVPHYMLHAYFEPNGQVLYDVWNPNLGCPIQGHLGAGVNGSFATYEFDYPGDESVYTVNLTIAPDAGTVLQNAGFKIYNPTGSVQIAGGSQQGLRPNVSANLVSRTKGRHVIQVYNYNQYIPIDFELSLTRGLPEGRAR